MPVMTPTLQRMPNQPKTPQRTVRVPDEVWDEARAAAERQGESISDVIRRSLEDYVKRNQDPLMKRKS
jgi:predicted HicB family RNase H-like nuclease